jgi:glucose-6-phosphate isomerase
MELDWSGWQIPECKTVAAELSSRGHTMLLLGVGGSALGAQAIRAALPGPVHGGQKLEILDTIDPVRVQRCLAGLDPTETVVVAVSKSGSTLETLALLRLCIQWLSDATGDSWTQRVAVVTDPDSGPLRTLAQERGLLSLPVPGNVGGRFSVLTAVGMLPAAFLGLDVDALCAGALAQRARVEEPSLERNPAWQIAAVHHCWREHLSNSVWLTYSDQLLDLGLWFRQLLAESLGKVGGQGRRRGWTPIVARGPADQHSQLQLWRDGPRSELFTIVHVDSGQETPVIPDLSGPEASPGHWLQGHTFADLSDAAREGTTASLIDSGAPVLEVSVPCLDEAAMGALFVVLESSVVLMGLMDGVDPFDQPAVEDAKRFAAGLLGREDCAADAAKARSLLEDLDPK